MSKFSNSLEQQKELAAATLVNMAYFCLNANRPEDAIKWCEMALKIDPRSPKAWNNKGAALQRLGKTDDALASFEKAIQSDPAYKLAWFQKGCILGQRGQYKEELQCYESALMIDPEYHEALLGKATALDDLGQYKEALALYDKVLSVSPSDSAVWYNRGNTLDHLGLHKEALQSYERAVNLNPQLISAWANMAGLLRNLERYEESIRCYDKALELDSNEARLHLGKGIAHLQAGQYQAAWSCALIAKQLRSPMAPELLAACMQKLSPEEWELISSALNEMPEMPNDLCEKQFKPVAFGRSLAVAAVSKQCMECGRQLPPGGGWFNIHRQALLCRDCALSSLPPEGKELLKNAERNPMLRQLQWASYHEETPPYFAYLNDASMPPFIGNKHAEQFIYQYAIKQPIGDLIHLWKNLNWVHASITSLTHKDQASFKIEWSEVLSHGVKFFDVYARNFNQGMLYPNVGMSGLRDFAHIMVVRKGEETQEAKDFRSSLPDTHILSELEGYGVFARSLAECLILAVHAAILKGAEDNLIAGTIKNALVDLLRENQARYDFLEEHWEKDNFRRIVEDIHSAITTDRLQLQGFVRIAECFLLALENMI